MDWQNLLQGGDGGALRAGLIGAGAFGASFLGQARFVRGLEVPVLCDREPAKAVAALRSAGREESEIRICETQEAALAALEAGRTAVVPDSAILMDLPLDMVIEATGEPEVGARNAAAAICHGKHVAMVTKETASAVGPFLGVLAREAGLVYTLVEGDQPSLLIGLIARARLLGFEVVAAGKSSEYDFVYDSGSETIGATVSARGTTVPAPEFGPLWALAPDGPAGILAARGERLTALPQRSAPDFCELLLVANATGLRPDRDALHAPIARTLELPEIFRPAAEGGLLERPGAVDVFSCLRRPDEMSFAGGVFAVVACPDETLGRLLAGKGLPASADCRHLLLHNPVHLLGAEAPVSIFSACRLEQPTSGGQDVPRYDMVARTTRHFAAGTTLTLGARHEIEGLEPLLLEARPLSDANPVPYYMAAGNRLLSDLPAGSLITGEMVQRPRGSTLWTLREEQDAHFLTG